MPSARTARSPRDEAASTRSALRSTPSASIPSARSRSSHSAPAAPDVDDTYAAGRRLDDAPHVGQVGAELLSDLVAAAAEPVGERRLQRIEPRTGAVAALAEFGELSFQSGDAVQCGGQLRGEVRRGGGHRVVTTRR